MSVRTTTVQTPAGDLRIAVHGEHPHERVVVLAFADHFDRVARRVRDRLADEEWVDGDSRAADALRRYVAGDLAALDDVEVDVVGTPFQQRVWGALRSIPTGATATYGEIAASIGAQGAVRAVGSANGANPVWLIVPCHRVVRSDGSVGGYGGGVERKSWLLAHEGAMRTPEGDPS